MGEFKKGDYIVLRHPYLAYNKEDREDDFYIEYVKLYDKYKNKRYRINFIEGDEYHIDIGRNDLKFFFNEIILIKPAIINKIKVS